MRFRIIYIRYKIYRLMMVPNGSFALLVPLMIATYLTFSRTFFLLK